MENSRKNKAMDLFSQGYNCAQAIVLAFSDLVPVDYNILAKMSSSFGGGMGRLREVCGAASGMFMVAGFLYGYDNSETGQPKANHYERIQQLAHQFEAENGSIVCRELLGLNIKHDVSTPEKRTDEYYKKRPCKELVGMAAEILDKYISENPFTA